MRTLASRLSGVALIMMTLNPSQADTLAVPYQAGTILSGGDIAVHHRLYRGEHTKPTATVVLIHGWSCDATYWDAQISDLLTQYPILTVDLAGHGQSVGQRDDFSMRAFGADVAQAVNQAIPEGPVILIGHSMGGPVSIEAARQLGSRVQAVIGVDTFKGIGSPPPDPAQTEARLQFFTADFAGATRIFVSQTFFREDADVALKARIAEDMASGDPTVGIEAIRGLNNWDGVAALRELAGARPEPLPILAINARHGSPTDLTRLQEIYPAFRLREMDGVGHFLMMEQPSAFNALLLEELALIMP